MMVEAAVKQRALEIGFDLVGIAPIAAWKDLEYARRWVERGYGGQMRYLENPKRHDPRRVLPSLKSVICVGLVYNAPFPYSTEVRSKEQEARSQERDGIESSGHRVIESLKERESSNGAMARSLNGTFRPDNGQGTRSDLSPTTDRAHQHDTPRAWISRYAWGADYHGILRAKLEELRAAVERLAPGVETRVYVDTGPIVERAFARLSGIGWTGKNTCLINEAKGSWFFLGVMLTSLGLAPDLPAPDRCGSCTRCIDACPTSALVEPYVMDASRCIAYFTIELKESIPAEFRPAIGANVFGCDICQDVCPWNAKERSQESGARSQNVPVGPSTAATTDIEKFQPLEVALPSVSDEKPNCSPSAARDKGPRTTDRFSSFDFRVSSFSLFNPPLEALASLTEEDFRRIFRNSPIKRVKYRGWLRNVCVAMGNSADAHFLPKLERLRQHADPIVREHARWAIERIRGNQAMGRKDYGIH